MAAGCGGGSGASSPSGSGSEQTVSGGNAKFTYTGIAKEQVQTAETGVTVTSLAGVSLTSFQFQPTLSLANTALAYVTSGADIYEYQNGVAQPVSTGTTIGCFDVKFDHSGHMYYTGENSSGQGQLIRCNYDGSSPTAVLTAATLLYEFDVSTSDAYIAFDETTVSNNPEGLFSATTSGTSVKSLDPAGTQPAISPNSTTVAYVKSVNGYSQVFTVPITGGTPTQLTTESVNHYYPAWTTDGLAIYCDFDNGTTRYMMGYHATGSLAGTQFDALLTTQYPYSSRIQFSPDGKFFTVTQAASYNNGNTTYVSTMTSNGGNYELVANNAGASTWSTYFTNKTFIGTSGFLATSGAGFILTQFQTGFDSMVSFNATTPSTSTVSLLNQNPAASVGPFVYDIHANSLTSVTYTNNYFGSKISATPGTTDCLVSIDGTTGQVTSLAPFLMTRSTPLQPSKGTLEYHAHFTAVYDRNGKNLAPSGATDLVLDPKHGSVLSVH